MKNKNENINNRYQNSYTQPLVPMPLFNNWDVVANGWYIACRSDELKVSGIRTTQIARQRLVIFRGEDGIAQAMDSYCPHMGVDLGLGKVVGKELRCFFHHWQYNRKGQCIKIPCLEEKEGEIPKKARLQSYATEEKYGFIWIYPSVEAPYSVPEFDELKGKPVDVVIGKPYERSCHHHVTMINGIDPQHLKTVHHLNIQMDLNVIQFQAGVDSNKNESRLNENGDCIDFILRGKVPHTTLKERLTRFLIGPQYEYSMRYVGGCIGLLTTMKSVRLFNQDWAPPHLHMIFAYVPLSSERTRVYPIFMTEKRPGIFGKMLSRFYLILTQMGFHALQGEDGQVYENIRFNPNALLPIDKPVARYIAYVNRLKPSLFSRMDGSTLANTRQVNPS